MTEAPRPIARDLTEALLTAAAQALEARGVDQATARAAAEGYRAHLHTIAVGLSLTVESCRSRKETP